MRPSPLKQDLKELAWAVLLLDAITLLTGALVAPYVGRPAVLLAAAFAVLITATLALIAAANLLVIGILRLRRRHGRRAHAPSSTVSQ